MDAEIKVQWVSALRQDGRRQTTGKLRDEWGAQCCLDVLCELAVDAGIISEPVFDAEIDCYVYSHSSKDGVRLNEFEVLPSPVILWAGLGGPDPEAHSQKYGTHSLAHFNDELELDFTEIANVIEASEL